LGPYIRTQLSKTSPRGIPAAPNNTIPMINIPSATEHWPPHPHLAHAESTSL